METWNREELYQKVWNEPVTKVATKYGVSDVMIAKICRKLSIPVPGRGFWARKAAGQKLQVKTLPKLKVVPTIQRFKVPPQDSGPQDSLPPAPEPNDSLYLQIRETESRSISIDSIGTRHKSVIATEKRLTSGRLDENGILSSRVNSGPYLDLKTSANTLGRALNLINAIIVTLENQGFEVSVGHGIHGTSALMFGHAIRFGLVERLEVARTREEEEGTWKRKVLDYKPTGNLELKVYDFTNGPRLRDRKRAKLEEILPQCVGALMRAGRNKVIAAEARRQREIADRLRHQELLKLSAEIREEEERVKQLEGYVNGWLHAREIRNFVTALEALWIGHGDFVASWDGDNPPPTGAYSLKAVWIRFEPRLKPQAPP